MADGSAWSTFAADDFGGERVMIEFKGSHFERDVILWAVRWYVAYPISYRQLEEMMEEHGVEVDHQTRVPTQRSAQAPTIARPIRREVARTRLGNYPDPRSTRLADRDCARPVHAIAAIGSAQLFRQGWRQPCDPPPRRQANRFSRAFACVATARADFVRPNHAVATSQLHHDSPLHPAPPVSRHQPDPHSHQL